MSSTTPEDPFFIHSDEEVVYANNSCLELLDSNAPDDVIGMSLSDFFTESSYETLRKQFHRLNSQQAPALGLNAELVPLEKDSFNVVVMTSPAEWGGETKLQSTIIDISEQLTAEPIFRRAMNSAPVGITIADATRDDEPLIYISDEFTDITGYSVAEALGQNCRFLQGAETQQEPVATMRAAIDAEEPVTVVLRNYRKDGSMFWNRVTIIPIRGKTGDVTHLLGYQEDVSEMKMYEHEKTLFEQQAEASPYAMLITNRDGDIEYVNPAFERMTGYSSTEAMGQNPRLLKSNKQDPTFYDNLWETITAGDIWEDELINRRKSGELYRVKQTIVPIQDDTGKITHFAAIERDISDTVFTEQVMDVVNRILRHNLRTSINVIDGYTDLLEGNLEDPQHLAAVDAISDRTEHLTKLSEKAGDIRVLFEDRRGQQLVSVSTIVDYIESCQKEYNEAAITLCVEVEDDVAIKNGSLLELAINESIENAVLHNDNGRPRIDIKLTREDDPPQLRIDIADNGSGIPQGEWDVITANEETPLNHGSGIGLWLIYWCITAIGGSIEMTRHGSYGSVLIYRLPLAGETA
jgi:PAS domain S-box-containing protein